MPMRRAVSGNTCIKPTAPRRELTAGLCRDSTWMMACSSAGSSCCSLAAAATTAANGNWAGIRTRRGADLLLLDEPTNYLDLEGTIWLRSFIRDYPHTILMISHDRDLLNQAVNSILHLERGKLVFYQGNYDSFERQRREKQALTLKQQRKQEDQRKHMMAFVERFRYKATKARQVQSRIKMLERMERVELSGPHRRIHFAFPQPPRTGRRVASLRGVHKAYGDTIVYAGIDLEVERGEKIALVGANGAGKSTLLRILAGVLPFEQGERVLGTHVTVHYYAQHQLDALDPATEHELSRRPSPIIVPFPSPSWRERERAPESLVLELLQRAIGYRVRL